MTYNKKTWKDNYDKRWDELITKECCWTINKKELKELEKLQEIRRKCLYPDSAKETAWQKKSLKLCDNFIKAAKAYTEFHKTHA